MKRIMLITLSALIEVDESDFTSHFEEIDKKLFSLSESADKILDTENRDLLGWRSTSTKVLDEHTMNCGRCSICESWITDCEKPNSISGLGYGAIYQNQLLCDDHLPEDHPWAF